VNQEVYERVRNNPKFSELIRKRSGLAWRLSSILIIVYFTFIFTIAFYPQLLSYKIGDSVVSIGIPIGCMIVFLCFILTFIYTKRSNNEFDELTNQIKDDVGLIHD